MTTTSIQFNEMSRTDKKSYSDNVKSVKNILKNDSMSLKFWSAFIAEHAKSSNEIAKLLSHHGLEGYFSKNMKFKGNSNDFKVFQSELCNLVSRGAKLHNTEGKILKANILRSETESSVYKYVYYTVRNSFTFSFVFDSIFKPTLEAKKLVLDTKTKTEAETFFKNVYCLNEINNEFEDK